MKIFDAFTFFNETKILKTRLGYLEPYVDWFYVVEGSQTFTGRDKPLYLQSSLSDLSLRTREKVVPFCWTPRFEDKTAWDREIGQRNAINCFVDEGNPEDVIIISDVDEIPNIDTVLNLNPKDLPVQLEVDQYFWNVNWRVPDHCNEGARPVVALRKHLYKNWPQNLRASSELVRVSNGGWHFSFFTEEENIVNKIESFAHTEYNLEEFKNYQLIRYRIENGIDPFDRFPLRYVELNENSHEILKRLSKNGEEFSL